jgi:hypothetical protein
VCFVVLVVAARWEDRAVGTKVASGAVLVHVQPPSMGARPAAKRSPVFIIRASKGRRDG